MNLDTRRGTGKRRDVLDIPGLDRAPFPGLQDLGYSLVGQTVPDRDGFIAPAQHEIQLDNPPLQIGPVVTFEGWHGAGKSDQVAARN